MKKIIIGIILGIIIIGSTACEPADSISEPLNCLDGYQEVDGKCEALEEVELTIVNQNLYMNGEVFYIKGVCWNPVPQGGYHPADLDYNGSVEEDALLMRAAGINVVRTYEPITDIDVLDTLYENGIYVINTVYPYGGLSVESAVSHVNNLKDHPAILMWAIGNEWNYNGLYMNLTFLEATERINEVAAAIKEADATHPITTIYGYLPSSSTVLSMPDIDIWGLNVYSGITFGTLFNDWTQVSDKPMYLAEYGADAWNSIINSLDEESQAEATKALTQIIIDQSQGLFPNNNTIGGTIFSFNDEWWKDTEGSVDTHDHGGIAPGGGPYPDSTFNEEYWGIVDINRLPRQAYYELQKLYLDS